MISVESSSRDAGLSTPLPPAGGISTPSSRPPRPPQRERNCACRGAVSSRFGTGVDASFKHKGQGLWIPARRPGRRVERSRKSAAIEAWLDSAVCESPPAGRGARGQNKRGGRLLCRPLGLERMAYFRLAIAVRSTESLAMPAAPHQFEPVPPGLIGVTLVVPEALKALVKALQLPLFRSVSE
jgi:hypothetical protein